MVKKIGKCAVFAAAAAAVAAAVAVVLHKCHEGGDSAEAEKNAAVEDESRNEDKGDEAQDAGGQSAEADAGDGSGAESHAIPID